MPVISPNAFAPSAANDAAGPVAADLREKVRRLERAHSADRAGQQAVPLGVPAIDALLPGGLLTGALHEIEAGPTPSGRVAPHDGAALDGSGQAFFFFALAVTFWNAQSRAARTTFFFADASWT